METDLKSTIANFVKDNASLGLRKMILLYDKTTRDDMSRLLADGVSEKELELRLEKSNVAFDTELSRSYRYINRSEEVEDRIARNRMIKERRELENQATVKELGIETIQQNTALELISRRRYNFNLPEPLTAKVLLVCVSFDQNRIRQKCIDIVSHFNTGATNNIEFFVVNPEIYGNPREGRRIWIDREHYFELPFGTAVNQLQYPDYDRLIKNGPYDFIIYVNCPIYGNRQLKGVSKDLESEGKLLNLLMREDSVLVIDPFDRAPRFTILALKAVGIDLIGIVESKTLKLGMFMKGSM